MTINLKPNPDNPRTIGKDEFERLKKKISENPDGLRVHRILHKDGIVIAGNQRWRALQELKLELKDEWFVDATGWTDQQITDWLIDSNVSEGAWDWDILANNFEPEYLAERGVEIPEALLPQEEVVEDEAPEVEDDPVSELGKIYQLGRHRVMCGDSTKQEDVEQLMNGEKADMVFTDPPYGIELDTDKEKVLGKTAKAKVYDRIIGDGEEYDANHIFDFFGDVKEVLIWGADYFIDTLPNFGKDGNFLVWDKRVTGHEDKKPYASEYELCWSKQKRARRIYKHEWVRFFGMQGEDTKKREHPNQKPYNLLIEMMPEGNLIVDLFLGSGSTLIACEQTDRTCYGMELDPKYVDVIRKRYAKFISPDDSIPENWEEITPAIVEEKSNGG